MTIGIISYAAAAILFSALGSLLVTSWRGRVHGGLLLLAVVASVAWAATAAYVAYAGTSQLAAAYYALEVARDAAWFAFLFRLLAPLSGAESSRQSGLRYAVPIVFGFSALVLAADVSPANITTDLPANIGLDFRIAGHLALALVGLALVEQLFRNTRPDRRWAVKYLFLGIGALFAYDFFLYADALLFKNIDTHLWQARGIVNALIVPLLAVSAARNPDWSLDVFVSRRMIFHAASLFGAGVYLLVMAGAGYYIRLYGGGWGTTIQAAFFFLALLLLLTLLFSGQMRARAKVFLSKHFFNYKFDYRDEWLKLSRTLTATDTDADMRERVIRALADIVDSPGGMLWTRTETGRFVYYAHWKLDEYVPENIDEDSSLVRFMAERQWVIDVQDYSAEPEQYTGLTVPTWLYNIRRAWLIVPLIQSEQVLAFVVLAKSRAPRHINWEDRDLLKTVGLQLASYVALMETTNALMNARQFEAFNRLSSYIVHDLKNISAQLSLVVSNAARHIDNPAFVEDAIRTVENATNRMNRMLVQLRKGKRDEGGKQIVVLETVLRSVAEMTRSRQPSVTVDAVDQDLLLLTEVDRLRDVLVHIVQNAQEATPPDGEVRLNGYRKGSHAVIEVQDTGCGMDGQFIRERLFRPFDTTKGNAGMGIGAFESREFIWSQGGDMVVNSTPGEGTSFSVRLPLYQDVPTEKPESKVAGSL